MTSVAALKAEGNTLFLAKNYLEAEKKYTAAIEASDTVDLRGLAVLHANRSACRLSLKRYLDAKVDATKATELDPNYAKAHARLATAQDQLGSPQKSKASWQNALDALPKTNLTPAEETQKTQYAAGLKAAMSANARMENTAHYIPQADPRGRGGTPFIWQGHGRMPWELAAPIVARFRTQGATRDDIRSSNFMNGINKMNQLTPIQSSPGAMGGVLGAVVDLTNGVMRDPRVMHLPDGDFISKYNKQIAFEATARRAWTDGGPEVIVREALARQRTEGWDTTRPALSITIRAWIMRAILSSGIYRQHKVAVEFYRNCLTVIKTLRDHWILESSQDRGVIFDESFVFGIQGLYLDAMMQSFDKSDVTTPQEVLEDLFKEAQDLVRDIEEALQQPRPPKTVDPGFVSSFFIYPKAKAYAMQGFYYNALALRRNANDPESGILFRKSAQQYLIAAESYPEDDEHHPCFLNVALEKMLSARTFPLRETLDVMKKIRLSVPKAKRIWERSSLGAAGVWDRCDRVASQEQELRDAITAGQFMLDACVGMEVEAEDSGST
ncbi:TPR-like protein [Favolaschia claudopus]|uniref:TPR-like protein n=1 Tax=Favolaschia claudopus TaxID=2862362 RepID=A0AAW0AT22_9AGAR